MSVSNDWRILSFCSGNLLDAQCQILFNKVSNLNPSLVKLNAGSACHLDLLPLLADVIVVLQFNGFVHILANP